MHVLHVGALGATFATSAEESIRAVLLSAPRRAHRRASAHRQSDLQPTQVSGYCEQYNNHESRSRVLRVAGVYSHISHAELPYTIICTQNRIDIDKRSRGYLSTLRSSHHRQSVHACE